MTPRIDLIADLLMGAAHADDHLDGSELETVERMLERVLVDEEIPDWLRWRIEDFDPAHLDVLKVVSKLGLDSLEDKRHLLELVVAVHESDEIWDLAEDDYLHEIGAALGLEAKDYEDLTIGELAVEVVGGELVDRPKPPPLPKDAPS